MRVIVCGGRRVGRIRGDLHSSDICASSLAPLVASATDVQLKVSTILDELHALHRFTCVITDGSVGAANLARNWAFRNGVESFTINARRFWFIIEGEESARKRLFAVGRPDLVVAFPGGDVTNDIIRLATLRKIPVIQKTI